MNKKLILTPLLFMAAIVTTNAQLMFRISGNGVVRMLRDAGYKVEQLKW